MQYLSDAFSKSVYKCIWTKNCPLSFLIRHWASFPYEIYRLRGFGASNFYNNRIEPD